MNTYISWAIFLAFFGGLTWHYSGRPNLFSRLLAATPANTPVQSPPTAATRKQKAKAKVSEERPAYGMSNSTEQPALVGNNPSKKRKIKAPEPGPDVKGAITNSSANPEQGSTRSETKDEGTKNAAFAREMAIARAGTQFTAAEKSGAGKIDRRTRKTSSILLGNDTDSPSLSAGGSSTTGGDADDDMSANTSPALAASSATGPEVSGGVSDMLEKPGPGPSVLRLTGVADGDPQVRSKQPKKAFEPAETKKQRQRRVKKEANRAVAEEVERERKKLMEKQIRGARMAEGTSAQTRSSNFNPQVTNVWQSNSGSLSNTAPSISNTTSALLDTFKSDDRRPNSATETINASVPASSTTVNGVSHNVKAENTGSQQAGNGKGEPSAKQRDWVEELPAEEEQLRLIQDSEDSWTTVSKKDKKKPTKQQEGMENDSSAVNGFQSSRTNGHRPSQATMPKAAPSSSANSYQQLEDSGLKDSEWAA